MKAQIYKTLIESIKIEEIKSLINGIDFVSKSPYSNSFYSSNDIGWNHKPDGSYRISDHWNFFSRGKYHCETSNEVPSNSWSLGLYDAESGKYQILKSFTCLHGRLMGLRYERRSRKEIKTTHRQNRIREIYLEKQRKEAAEKRAAKIRNGLLKNKKTKIWVEVNVNVWSGSGRNIRFSGTRTYVGYLMWESKSGKSFRIMVDDMYEWEIRKWNSYKELSRKPIKRKK